jgi:putative tricarboxylic transport membrane protein
MLISRGDIWVFVERPISALFLGICVLLIGTQIYVRLKGRKAKRVGGRAEAVGA